jgi:hypothetical protein
VIADFNNEIYGYQNEHAFISTGPRINSHTVAPTPQIGIQDPLINAVGYEDPDLADPYYNDYDQNFVYNGINQGLVGTTAGHHIELGFGSGPATSASHSRAPFPLHHFHNSQSMHEHSGKNLSKIQQSTNLVDFGAGGMTTTNIFGRPLHTPPPIGQDPSQFNFRNMNSSAPHGY